MAVWFGGERADLMTAPQHDRESRRTAGRARPLPDVAVAARLALKTAPQRFDEVVLRARVIDARVAAVAADAAPPRRTTATRRSG
jgi:hypothetical protein